MIEDLSVSEDPEIERLRQHIDRLDHEILVLLRKRAELALQVGDCKRKDGLSVYDPIREKALLDRLAGDGELPLDPRAIGRVFEAIVCECRRLEEQHVHQEQEPINQKR